MLSPLCCCLMPHAADVDFFLIFLLFFDVVSLLRCPLWLFIDADDAIPDADYFRRLLALFRWFFFCFLMSPWRHAWFFSDDDFLIFFFFIIFPDADAIYFLHRRFWCLPFFADYSRPYRWSFSIDAWSFRYAWCFRLFDDDFFFFCLILFLFRYAAMMSLLASALAASSYAWIALRGSALPCHFSAPRYVCAYAARNRLFDLRLRLFHTAQRRRLAAWCSFLAIFFISLSICHISFLCCAFLRWYSIWFFLRLSPYLFSPIFFFFITSHFSSLLAISMIFWAFFLLPIFADHFIFFRCRYFLMSPDFCWYFIFAQAHAWRFWCLMFWCWLRFSFFLFHWRWFWLVDLLLFFRWFSFCCFFDDAFRWYWFRHAHSSFLSLRCCMLNNNASFAMSFHHFFYFHYFISFLRYCDFALLMLIFAILIFSPFFRDDARPYWCHTAVADFFHCWCRWRYFTMTLATPRSMSCHWFRLPFLFAFLSLIVRLLVTPSPSFSRFAWLFTPPFICGAAAAFRCWGVFAAKALAGVEAAAMPLPCRAAAVQGSAMMLLFSWGF